ncbi:hypothetical protein AVEN_155569-1 [Araneus ventricosus]|uniref:Integrase p58-like C-terminal domain-containing protein n=1 Tax=Araneus ventricosus TaxID=182803 RepID=A0A4Y2XC66_ARAVE|nr:hypothetical protein AVEN_155569-1 [Araneus ventricosus]
MAGPGPLTLATNLATGCITRSDRGGLSPKLQQNWEGPYTIVKKLIDVIYRVQRSPNAKPKVIHINWLAPYRDSDLSSMLSDCLGVSL